MMMARGLLAVLNHARIESRSVARLTMRSVVVVDKLGAANGDDAAHVGLVRIESRPNGVGQVIFSREQNHVAGRLLSRLALSGHGCTARNASRDVQREKDFP